MTSFLFVLLSAAAAAAPESPFLRRQDPEAPAAAFSTAPAAQPKVAPAFDRLLRRGHAAYFQGDYAQAVTAYEGAIRISSTAPAPWLNGGAVLEEAGDSRKAAYWYGRAVGLDAGDNEAISAAGWAQLRARDPAGAEARFQLVLQRDPDHAAALLGLARAELATSRAQQAVAHLTRAAASSPLAGLAGFFLGRAYESIDSRDNAVAAYRRSVGADSYFLEGRQALGRLYLRLRSFNEAYRQFARVLEAEPHNPDMTALAAKVHPLLARGDGPPRPEGLHLPSVNAAASPAFPPRVPVLRVGIGTNPMGRARARQVLAFAVSSDFVLTDAKTGKSILSGGPDEPWTVRVQARKKRLYMELVRGGDGQRILRSEAFLIVPRDRDRGLVGLNLSGLTRKPATTAEKLLRGEVEIALFRRNLRVVNRIDLENYTHGVVSAEMPIRSPGEALKAQAVVARTHAIFIKGVTRRHRKDGYDVCDEQHCQVYAGARAESERSRAVVEGTHGVIATYHGRPAHVIYSSNCGGRTQSGRDLTGWGDVPYWNGIIDAPVPTAPLDSPWALRRWLTSLPPAYCKPSYFVHPSHFRWTRFIPWTELSRKLDRRLRIGRLQSIRTLRRSPSGNVNALLVAGSRRRAKVDSEMAIRGLLGTGSLRSTLFIFTTEAGADGKPESLVITGGGWGHAVGLCQSGAMGRAEAGQDFGQIVRAYYPGVELGRSDYAPGEASGP